jgi:hypothetical protein
VEVKRLALVLVDISGYTRFVKMHTMSLLHAESIITDLLGAVIDNAEFPLTLSKLEGDAAFLYSVLEEGARGRAAAEDILRQVDAFFAAFDAKASELVAADACRCDACSNIPMLKLKSVLHVGPAVIKKVRQFEEVAGEDVIVVHRLLKNTVPFNEYVLMTQAFYDLSGGFPGRTAEARVEECEGFGPVAVKVYYKEDAARPLPPRPAPMPPIPGTTYGNTSMRWSAYAVARVFGRSRSNFSHLPDATLTPADLWAYFVTGLGGNIVTIARYWLGRKA